MKTQHIVILLLSLSCFACAATEPARPATTLPASLTLMPFMDARVDKSISLDLEEAFYQPVMQSLRERGFQVQQASGFSNERELSLDEVIEMTDDELAKLGPSNARLLVFLILEDYVAIQKLLAWSYKCEMMIKILDKHTKAVRWKRRSIGNFGQAGLVGAPLSPLNRHRTLSSCAQGIIRNMPSPE